MPEATRVTVGGLKSLLGLDPTNNTIPTKALNDVSFVNRYSPSELKTFLNRLYVKPEQNGSNAITAGGLIPYLRPIHDKISTQKIEAEKLRKLAPEIEQSRILVSSSILSPNDLQDGEFKFNFDDVPALANDPDLLREVSEYYSKYFNTQLELGIKSYDWIGDAMYGSGAKCMLILPVATQLDLRTRTQDTVNKSQYNPEAGFESFDEYIKHQDDYIFSGKKLSWKDYLTKDKTSVEDLVPSMESYGVQVPLDFCSKAEADAVRRKGESYMYGSSYTAGLESMIVNLKARLSEGDIIRVTENTDSFKYLNTNKEKVSEDLWDKLAAHYGFNERPVREELAILNANPSRYKHMGHPTLIELPTESVVPIFVPGAPNEHLGYFVLLDDHGQPLSAESSGAGEKGDDQNAGTSTAAAFDAMFGNNCCNASYFNSTNSYSQMGNLIFSNILDGYIKTRMKGILHRDDLELGRFGALANILFHRTLEAKESMLVFVPTMLLHYFAFDYDKNTGCGRSKISDIQFLLSLRTTLMMANVVSSVNDAVEHKKIEFGVDDKNANVEAIMELIASIFIEKNRLNGSIDPSEIMRDMYSNSLTIVPKNLPGLSDVSVEVGQSGNGGAKVDDQTLEQLNNLITAQLDVPASALNQLSEPEYARSLVVGNLFFAKKITRYQNIWCKEIAEFIRVYTLVDPVFQKGLCKILNNTVKLHFNENLPDAVKKLKRHNPNKYSDMNDLPDQILNTVRVELPKPNIVVDKSQFEEINNYINNLQTVADKFFNNEMIPSDDQLAQTALPLIKAKWMSDQVSKFITEVGSFKMCDIPDLDDIDVGELTSYIQAFQNVGAGVIKHRTAISQPAAEGEGGFGGDEGFGGSGGGFEDAGMGSEEGGGESSEGGSDFDNLGGLDTGESNAETPGENNGPEMLARMYVNNVKKK